MLLYCVPMSGPCLFSCVGLCMFQNISSSCSYDVCSGSYIICIASACPVLSVHTCLYVGFFVFPPVYPTVVCFTPFVFWNVSSTPQKHPAAKVAFSIF